MNVHFSPEDVSRWVAGERTPGLAQHLSCCNECQIRVEELSRVLGQFRDAVRDFSAEEDRLACFEFEPRPKRVDWHFALASAAATAALAFMLMSPRPASHVKVAAPQRSDAELLSRVQEQISRSVPEHMEPLTELFAWSLPSQDADGFKNEE
jgi:hypothetical protein